MKKRIVLIAVAATVVGGSVGWFLRGFWAVDACLDAGGAWEQRGGYCIGAVYGPLQE